MSSEGKFKWDKAEQEALKEIKRNVAFDILLACTDFNKEFKIHTNARDFQLKAVIIQDGKPITLNSRN